MKLHEKTIYWHKSVCCHPPGPALKSPPDHYPGRLSLIIKIRKEPDNDNIIKVPVLRWQPKTDFIEAKQQQNANNPNTTAAYIDEMTGGSGDREWMECLDETDELRSNSDRDSKMSKRTLDEEVSSPQNFGTSAAGDLRASRGGNGQGVTTAAENDDDAASDITDIASEPEENIEIIRPHDVEEMIKNKIKKTASSDTVKNEPEGMNPPGSGAKFLTTSLFDGTCNFFQTDLDQVRSIRAHFNRGGTQHEILNDKIYASNEREDDYDPRVDCGQMIICSLDSQYKVFHFHNGGLQIIVRLLLKWSKAARESIDKLPVPIYAHPALREDFGWVFRENNLVFFIFSNKLSFLGRSGSTSRDFLDFNPYRHKC